MRRIEIVLEGWNGLCAGYVLPIGRITLPAAGTWVSILRRLAPRSVSKDLKSGMNDGLAIQSRDAGLNTNVAGSVQTVAGTTSWKSLNAVRSVADIAAA